MAEYMGPLSGKPLAEQMRILGEQGLAVEGTCARGVTEVIVSTPGGQPETVPVRPLVVWDAQGDATTLYFPR